jgi:hypothetical protein
MAKQVAKKKSTAKKKATAKKTIKDPIMELEARPQCEFPVLVDESLRLTPAEEKALHQFHRRVVTAGQIMYKKIPKEKAIPAVRRKWLQVAKAVR